MKRIIGMVLSLFCMTVLVLGCTIQETELHARIPMVMLDGKLYYDTGKESTTETRREEIDGEILSSVTGIEVPTANAQSNFGKGYAYQYGSHDTIEVCIDGNWFIFEYRSGDGSLIRFEDQWYCKEELSAETLEWLFWYNGLSEEEQMTVDAIPSDLPVSQAEVMTEDAAP